MKTHTSLKLSKMLYDVGFIKESKLFHEGAESLVSCTTLSFKPIGTRIKPVEYPAYDILNDLCVRYAKEIFGEESDHEKKQEYCEYCQNYVYIVSNYYRRQYKILQILELLQAGKKEEAEQYIIDNCILFKK